MLVNNKVFTDPNVKINQTKSEDPPVKTLKETSKITKTDIAPEDKDISSKFDKADFNINSLNFNKNKEVNKQEKHGMGLIMPSPAELDEGIKKLNSHKEEKHGMGLIMPSPTELDDKIKQLHNKEEKHGTGLIMPSPAELDEGINRINALREEKHGTGLIMPKPTELDDGIKKLNSLRVEKVSSLIKEYSKLTVTPDNFQKSDVIVNQFKDFLKRMPKSDIEAIQNEIAEIMKSREGEVGYFGLDPLMNEVQKTLK